MDSLLGICVTTIEEASAYLNRPYPSEETEKVAAAVNQAAATLESLTGRRLAFRTHRAQITIAITTLTAGSFQFAAALALDFRVGDFLSCLNLRPGTKVVFRTDSLVGLSAPIAVTGTENVTVDSRPDLVDGPGFFWGTEEKQQLYLSEYPVVEVFEIKEIDSNGIKSAVDLTGLRLGEFGRVVLPNAAPSKRDLNLEIHYSAGLRLPSTTYRGDSDAMIAQQATHRLAQVFFQDSTTAAGRATEMAFGSVSRRSNDFRLPSDILEKVEQLRRRP